MAAPGQLGPASPPPTTAPAIGTFDSGVSTYSSDPDTSLVWWRFDPPQDGWVRIDARASTPSDAQFVLTVSGATIAASYATGNTDILVKVKAGTPVLIGAGVRVPGQVCVRVSNYAPTTENVLYPPQTVTRTFGPKLDFGMSNKGYKITPQYGLVNYVSSALLHTRAIEVGNSYTSQPSGAVLAQIMEHVLGGGQQTEVAPGFPVDDVELRFNQQGFSTSGWGGVEVDGNPPRDPIDSWTENIEAVLTQYGNPPAPGSIHALLTGKAEDYDPPYTAIAAYGTGNNPDRPGPIGPNIPPAPAPSPRYWWTGQFDVIAENFTEQAPHYAGLSTPTGGGFSYVWGAFPTFNFTTHEYDPPISMRFFAWDSMTRINDQAQTLSILKAMSRVIQNHPMWGLLSDRTWEPVEQPQPIVASGPVEISDCWIAVDNQPFTLNREWENHAKPEMTVPGQVKLAVEVAPTSIATNTAYDAEWHVGSNRNYVGTWDSTAATPPWVSVVDVATQALTAEKAADGDTYHMLALLQPAEPVDGTPAPYSSRVIEPRVALKVAVSFPEYRQVQITAVPTLPDPPIVTAPWPTGAVAGTADFSRRAFKRS